MLEGHRLHRLQIFDGCGRWSLWTIRHVEAINDPVFSASGELLEIIATGIDLTERKHAAQALRWWTNPPTVPACFSSGKNCSGLVWKWAILNRRAQCLSAV